MKTFWAIVILSSLCSGQSRAEGVKDRTAMCQMEWQKLSGRVESWDAENHRLQLRDQNGNLAHLVLDDNIQVFRDWRLVTLDDLKDNDRVTLRRSGARL
jgi:hypothetical protein